MGHEGSNILHIKESGMPLTKTEFDNIFRYFDKNCDDEVSLDEFIGFLRGTLRHFYKLVPLNERR